MSKLRIGDKVFYRGNLGIVEDVLNDGREDYYRIGITEKTTKYLYFDEIDLVTPQLNENQEIVLGWLKKHMLRTDMNPFGTVSVFNKLFVHGHMKHEMVKTFEELSYSEMAQVLQAFSQWVLEQQECESNE